MSTTAVESAGVDLRRSRRLRRSRSRGTRPRRASARSRRSSGCTVPEYPEFWAITKHADVMEIERNPEIFTNAPVPALAPSKRRRGDGRDAGEDADPDGRRRAQGAPQHRQRLVQARRTSSRCRTGSTSWPSSPSTGWPRWAASCDFVKDVALHFPLQVILSILGLPERRLRPDAEADPGAVRRRGPRHRPRARTSRCSACSWTS